MDSVLSRFMFGAMLSICGGVAAAAEPANDSNPPELAARWLASCEANEQREYLSVKVFASGDVRYVGGNQAKEVGERSAQIKPTDARYLATRAADFIRAPAAPAYRTPRGAPPVACMEFETRVDGRVQVRRESIQTRASKVFSNDLARKVPLLAWACPARATPETAELSLAGFCSQWPKGEPRAR